jgi:ZIP family zinc transporter
MEAGTRAARRTPLPGWLSGLAPLALLGVGIAVFLALGAPGLERTGVPQEELTVERTVLHPDEIQLRVRNDGADAVDVRQVLVNDAFAPFEESRRSIGRLAAATITIAYPWIEGQNYDVTLITTTGGTIDHQIEAATETPSADVGFYGLMALIGLYVGIIPVAIGMLWLPWVRQIDQRWVQFLLALTLGLLLFLAIDATLEGIEFANGAPEVFGGPALVFLGGIVAYLALAGVDGWLRGRRQPESAPGASLGGLRLALLIAVGIGLHNLGEGLAIGSAYAIGSLALGATLIVGFALHNTTEGLAIVAPVADENRGARVGRLVLLGLVAGAPAILGAWIGASAFDASLASFMFGLGAGAIAQVVVQLAPSVRDEAGRLLHPLAVGGLLAGLLLMYATGLLVSV